MDFITKYFDVPPKLAGYERDIVTPAALCLRIHKAPIDDTVRQFILMGRKGIMIRPVGVLVGLER